MSATSGCQAELARRWLAGKSEDEIGKSLGYERKLGRPIHDAILRFVNNQLSERREWYQRMRYDQDSGPRGTDAVRHPLTAAGNPMRLHRALTLHTTVIAEDAARFCLALDEGPNKRRGSICAQLLEGAGALLRRRQGRDRHADDVKRGWFALLREG
jgi:hypothetical protein